jgi:RNA polymerase sigma-70 factor (ECF subfamily)
LSDSIGGAWEDDRDLVRRMLAGDEAAFDRFFDDASPGLLRFALRRLENEADAAEEIVQLTLTQAFRKLHTYRGEAALFTWLCAICRREILAHWRRRQRLGREIGLADEDPAVRAAVEGQALEEDAAAAQRSDVIERVQATLESLPQRYGDALEWKYVEEVPVEEVGRRLGLGLKAAESLLTRAREAFRKAFAAGEVSRTVPTRTV